MSKPNCSLFSSLVFVILSASLVWGDFWNDSKEGYYWNDSMKEEAIAKPEANDSKPPPVSAAPQDYTYEELWALPPAAFREYLTFITERAVQSPTLEHAQAYLTAQDVAKRKSLAFTSVVALAGQMRPDLANNSDIYPVAAPGRRAVTAAKLSDDEEALATGAGDFGLIVFVQDGCEFCSAQEPITRQFQMVYGWAVRELNIFDNPDLAAEYGVDWTPSIIAVQRDTGEAIPVSNGVIDLAEMKATLARVVRYYSGQNAPEQWFLRQHQRDSGTDPLKFVRKAN